MVYELLGFLGTLLIVIAYVPQIRHILKEHCSGGVSRRAWLLWLAASILILTYALSTQDNVFILLQFVNIIAIVIILFLIRSYHAQVCHSKEEKFKKKK